MPSDGVVDVQDGWLLMWCAARTTKRCASCAAAVSMSDATFFVADLLYNVPRIAKQRRLLVLTPCGQVVDRWRASGRHHLVPSPITESHSRRVAAVLIELSKDQERQLFELAAARTCAEVDADCEPSGVELVISLCGPYGAAASVRIGKRHLELGDVLITLSGDPA